MKNKILLGVISVLVALSSFLLGKVNNPLKVLSGAGTETQYIATTTSLAAIPNFSALCKTHGTLGAVNITNATGASANGRFMLYDATTTITNGLWATTTIASFATNIAVGYYSFDTVFSKGLLLQYDGAMGSTTITYSCGS